MKLIESEITGYIYININDRVLDVVEGEYLEKHIYKEYPRFKVSAAFDIQDQWHKHNEIYLMVSASNIILL